MPSLVGSEMCIRDRYCSRTRCCALWFVDDDGRALFCRAIHKPFSIIFVVAEMTSTLTTSATSRQCIILHYVRNRCMPETRNLSSSSTWWVRWTGPLYSWTTRASSIETLFALFWIHNENTNKLEIYVSFRQHDISDDFHNLLFRTIIHRLLDIFGI